MRTAEFLFVFYFAAATFAGHLDAQQNATVKVKSDEIWRSGIERQRTRSRRLGDRGNHRSAHALHQGSRHRRSRPLSDSRLCPTAKYTVWARGYGLVDSPKVQTEPGKQVDLKPTVAPDTKAAAQLLSGELLVRDAEGAGEERISGHGPARQRHFAEHQERRASGCT